MDFNLETFKINMDENEQIMEIKGGENHTAILTTRRQVYLAGRGNEGQLGIKAEYLEQSSKFTWIDQCAFIPIPFKMEAKILVEKLSVGDDFTIILDIEHTVWGFGSNEKGRLGLGKEVFNIFDPHKIPFDQPIIDVQCNHSHSLAQTVDGDIYEWGFLADQLNEEINLNETKYVEPLYSPLKKEGIPFVSKILSIACGFNCNFVLLCEGIDAFLYTWGLDISSNNFFDWTDSVKSIKLPDILKTPADIKKISSGYEHLIISDMHGSCFAIGSNQFYQISTVLKNIHLKDFLEIPEFEPKYAQKVMDFVCGAYHTAYYYNDNISMKSNNIFTLKTERSPFLIEMSEENMKFN